MSSSLPLFRNTFDDCILGKSFTFESVVANMSRLSIAKYYRARLGSTVIVIEKLNDREIRIFKDIDIPQGAVKVDTD